VFAQPTIAATAVVLQPQRLPTPTNEERWQAQQLHREPFEPPRVYIAPQGTALFWFDPHTGQTLEIGTLLGEFTTTAGFIWRANNQPALLVPYQINGEYGLTAISEATVTRMRDAGYTERVEAFVLVSDSVQPK
jgi:hypothetical protein